MQRSVLCHVILYVHSFHFIAFYFDWMKQTFLPSDWRIATYSREVAAFGDGWAVMLFTLINNTLPPVVTLKPQTILKRWEE